MNYHLYEILLESSQMWVKMSVPMCVRGTGEGVFRHSLWRRKSNPSVPVRPYRTFDLPTTSRSASKTLPTGILSRIHFLRGWDGREFKLAGGPYPWCETLAEGCDCHGSEDELSAAYCSDFGVAGDVEKHARKSDNIRYAENLRKWEARVAAMDSDSGKTATIPGCGYSHGRVHPTRGNRPGPPDYSCRYRPEGP